MEEWTNKLDVDLDGLGEIMSLRPFGPVTADTNILSLYDTFCKKKLAFDMGIKWSDSDLIKMYELKYKDNPKETPYRLFLKELFRYSDHVDLLTFRNNSLLALMKDSEDPRKHVSFDTVAAS